MHKGGEIYEAENVRLIDLFLQFLVRPASAKAPFRVVYKRFKIKLCNRTLKQDTNVIK